MMRPNSATGTPSVQRKYPAVVFRFAGGNRSLKRRPTLVELEGACEDGYAVIIEVSGVRYIDSAGIKA